MKLHPEILESIKIAARFGFITRQIYCDFVATSGERMVYKLWKRITEEGFFEFYRHDLISKNYLKLSKKGKNFAQGLNFNPVTPPFMSVLSHDELLVRFVLANERAGYLADVKTEANLKADPSLLKSRLSQKQKYPDLLLRLPKSQNGSRLAVEHERSRKSQATYKTILIAYSIFRDTDMVLFIVGSEAIENAIRSQALRIQYPFSKRPLVFAFAKDALANPTSFPVRLGKEIISFSDLAQGALGNAKEVA